MAYNQLETREASPAVHPGLKGYSPMMTRNTQGFRGLGAIPPISFSLGPGGQFSVGVQSVPTATSLWDQAKLWASQETFLPGTPNLLVAIVAGLTGFGLIFRGRR